MIDPGLLDLPDLVIDRVLSFMNFADLCRLRQTCNAFRDLTPRFLRRLTVPKMEIGDHRSGSPTFESAIHLAQNLQLNIQVLYIKASTDTVYASPHVQDFLDQYGHGIRKVKLSNYFLANSKQLHFLQSLPNVLELKIELIDGMSQWKYPRFQGIYDELPGFFQNLKVLKFGTIHIYKSIDTSDFWYQMIRGSPRLGYIRFPSIKCDDYPTHGAGSCGDYNFKLITAIIRRQRKSFFPGDCMKIIDMKNLDFPAEFHEEPTNFNNLVDRIKDMGVKLINVNAHYFRAILPTLDDYDCVGSIYGYERNMALLPLRGLEQITIFIRNIDREQPRWEWENVKSIRIHYDLQTVITRPNNTTLLAIHEYLITAPARNENLEELQFIFEPETREYQTPSRILNLPGVCFGVGKCLKKLSLVNWNPINSAFPKLWTGLLLLEELHLENCPSLGNVGFIGTNERSPAFLKLTRLVKLTLVLDEMKKITDRAFKDVFSRMRLREFYLKSTHPLENVKREGILSLVDGEFGRTIERFPFTGWTLAGVNVEEMVKLKSRFKSLIA